MLNNIKIGILDLYGGTIGLSKDPGMLSSGFPGAVFLTLNPEATKGNYPFQIKILNAHNLYNLAFWEHLDVEVIIFYSGLKPENTSLVKLIKRSGKKLIIKSDSDGTLGYPLKPRYVNVVSFKRNFVRWVGRQIKWSLPIYKFVSQKIEQIRISDAVVVESPEALVNMVYILHYWKHTELIKKLYVIPNPTREEFITTPIENKENIVISVGRYTEEDIKNTPVLINSLKEFLTIRPDFRAIIVGSVNSKYILHMPLKLRKKIAFTGWIESKQIAKLMASSKIFFHPSKLEGFCLSAGEAVCMGNSIVGGPLECLNYLSNNNTSGTISYNFETTTMVAALIEDSYKWDRNIYHTDSMTQFWREQLNINAIARLFLDLIKLL